MKPAVSVHGTEGSGIISEQSFLRLLDLEQKRTVRSCRSFVLMLLESRTLLKSDSKSSALNGIVCALACSMRDTDITGWYKEGSAVGIIFTEIGENDGKAVGNALLTKIRNVLSKVLSAEQIGQLKLSCFVFPEDWDETNADGSTWVPRREPVNKRREVSRFAKRCIDVAGSLAAIILCAPLLVVIAVAVKLTSKGPVLFRQKRQGQYGRAFTFLKFRSMYVSSDPKVHEEFIKRMILRDPGLQRSEGDQPPVYKLTKDSRITRIGGILRRTSLDELPQFFNVLRGEMSLVGPRPPIPYEVEHYEPWHRRRLQEAKPGITGLWQVYGRSKTTFDEMVRLDLQYARTWSVWLDLKILLATPKAVLRGSGAY
jgi:lipopolysaccharide/colanic/teichoic acid biosynthesis glycosyltransferase